MTEIVSKLPQNDPTEKAVRTQSRFPLSRHRKLTARFGEYVPFFDMESVERDSTTLRVRHDVRSFTLKSPLLSNLKIKKDYFQVPMEAILPRNWEKIYTNPVIGDDVPDDAICASDQFWRSVIICAQKFLDYIADWSPAGDNPTEAELSDFWTRIFNFLLFGEMFFSNGSLVKYCDAMPSRLFRYYDLSSELLGEGFCDWSFDQFEEGIFSKLLNVPYMEASVNGVTYYVNLSGFNPTAKGISFRDFLCIARDQGFVDSLTVPTVNASRYLSQLLEVFADGSGFIILESSDQPSVRIPFNWARCAAYQLICYHYYSNDHIDYIYSSQLYRDYLNSFIDNLVNFDGDPYPSFSYNGTLIFYDVLSARNVISIINKLTDLIGDPDYYSWPISFLRALFGFNYSLRFVDYFTGAKSRPLAVGDVSVDTSGNNVSVVDITRNIQRQRFLNAVNRTGRKFSDYIKGLFGVSVAPDWHNPFFLSHVEDTIITSEVENTADAQQTDPVSVTSVFRANSANYAFEFQCDRPSILVGILYFDIPRDYYQGIDRLTMHLDRFDMFNPFMQYIGDQPVYCAERDSNVSDAPMLPFGYQMRHAEYKQAVSRAVGGFIDFLPGWTFLADHVRPFEYLEHIGPSYIRSTPSELDEFYLALSGYSLAGYFHFIIDLFIDCESSRPMAFAPTIL